MKRKANSNYEFVTMKGNCFVFNTYKCNGYYCYDIYRQSNIDGKTLTHCYSGRSDEKSRFFMTLNNMEFYLDNTF